MKISNVTKENVFVKLFVVFVNQFFLLHSATPNFPLHNANVPKKIRTFFVISCKRKNSVRQKRASFVKGKTTLNITRVQFVASGKRKKLVELTKLSQYHIL